MRNIDRQITTHPYKTVDNEVWDEEWAAEWIRITEIFNTIDRLESLFNELDVSVLRQLSQQKLIIDLKKYTYSLSKVLEQKFND